jgi:predicted dithiol-disulfide oxidoreductase (DUF899 family)
MAKESSMNSTTTTSRDVSHPVATREDWLVQRLALLEREKELTHLSDAIARDRQAMPWVKLDKCYVFDTTSGRRTLAELFDGRRQLMVQHFMLGPGWEQGCQSCSFMTDHLEGTRIHLEHRDLSVMLVSRAPLSEIERFRRRMGWNVAWVSSHDNDFNRDFAVSFQPQDRVDGEVAYNYGRVAFPHSEAPGISFFWRDDSGDVFHTYSTYGRGLEAMMGSYDLLDMAPRGRDEDHLAYGMAWVRHHDRYDDAVAPAPVAACCASNA